jgi:hypothetical protein
VDSAPSAFRPHGFCSCVSPGDRPLSPDSDTRRRAEPPNAATFQIIYHRLIDETPNLVLDQLCAIREELREIREEQREERGRFGAIDRSISHMAGEIAQMGLRLDRMHHPLDRIARRLDIVDV